MTVFTLRPASSTFRRIGGREGGWRLHARQKDPSFPLDPDDNVVCPFEFVEVPGLQAEDVIEELRIAYPRKTPILFGSPYETGVMLERRTARAKTADQWLRETETFDLDAWFAQRVDEVVAWQTKTGKILPRRGPWPAQSTKCDRLTVPFDILTNEPKSTVIIGLIPTADPTETAAHLGFGGWNDCPSPPVHILLARQWHERYGAIQVSNTYETVEFKVAKPVADREDALRLAMDQYHWCGDSIPETLQAAAAELIGSTVWVFWWD